MKITAKFIISLILALPLLAACSQDTPHTATPFPTASLPSPAVYTTRMPDASSTAQQYLDAWKAGDYKSMYGLLASDSRANLTEEAFAQKYQEIAMEAALKNVDYALLSKDVSDSSNATVGYQVTLHSNVVGDIARDTQMTLSQENGQWKVKWDPTMILPELANGHTLRMDLEIPERANIYDRNGKPLAEYTEATSIGLYPDNMDPDQVEEVLVLLSRATGLRVDTIENMYINNAPGTTGYLALGEVPTASMPNLLDALSNYSGVALTNYAARFYPQGGIAPHVVGYVGQIQKEELENYRRLGYRIDERVGQRGIENWGENYLGGKHGGTLYVFDEQGTPVSQLAQAPAEPAQAITTTIDADLQAGAQQAIAGFRGAIVVLERDTGRVLAMVSSPGFDPNAYETANANWSTLLGEYAQDPNQPGYNRATEGLYPLGSVFKIITSSAALNSGVFTKDSTYDCQYDFTELAGLTLHDWTWDHFQQDEVTQPSGMLTLPQGLIRSCNPWFYHIGLDLYNKGLTKAVSDMARGFGLGSKTGIEGIAEQTGTVPDPGSQVDATNLAIGQGDLQVTPLQVADFVAAVGNGGTLYRPQLIERIAPPNSPPDGPSTKLFTSEVRGKLPVKPEDLKIIQDAMRGVVESKKPRGTAYNVFTGFGIPIAAKTGTATSGSGNSHAWFAGYTMAENPDKPDIAIAVIAENAGEGSEIAAPIFRRVVEQYFFGKPIRPYRWESSIGVTRTPTPIETETETPTPEEGVDVTPEP